MPYRIRFCLWIQRDVNIIQSGIAVVEWRSKQFNVIVKLLKDGFNHTDMIIIKGWVKSCVYRQIYQPLVCKHCCCFFFNFSLCSTVMLIIRNTCKCSGCYSSKTFLVWGNNKYSWHSHDQQSLYMNNTVLFCKHGNIDLDLTHLRSNARSVWSPIPPVIFCHGCCFRTQIKVRCYRRAWAVTFLGPKRALGLWFDWRYGRLLSKNLLVSCYVTQEKLGYPATVIYKMKYSSNGG